MYFLNISQLTLADGSLRNSEIMDSLLTGNDSDRITGKLSNRQLRILRHDTGRISVQLIINKAVSQKNNILRK